MANLSVVAITIVITIVTAVVAAVLIPPGGAVSNGPAHHSARITRATAGRQYAALAWSAVRAIATFDEQAQRWRDSTTAAREEADAKPLMADLSQFNSGLLVDQWPPGDEAAVKGLVKDIAPIIGDQGKLSTINLLNSTSFSLTFHRDLRNLLVGVGTLGRELGLPPA